MTTNYYQCESCGVFDSHTVANDERKFPFTRRELPEGGCAVRCKECTELPYRLEEGQPFRIYIGDENGLIRIWKLNRKYNFWPNRIGHLLEILEDDPSHEYIQAVQNGPVDIGFFVERDVNLIVVTIKLKDQSNWVITPFSWHEQPHFMRATPNPNPLLSIDRHFRISLVNSHGGKIVAIRCGTMPTEFAITFHQAILRHIQQSVIDWDKYKDSEENLHKLLIGNKLATRLDNICRLE
ncbi:MAG: hypothetical protein L0229_21835 [Blastocatellia bacterium]|nr:hypothetical protein [Blastocatellia bacterium]